MTVKRTNRWSLAFADLSLLMMGFVVLSFVRPETFTDAAEASIPLEIFEWPTASLFESNEAMLSKSGRQRARSVALVVRERSARVELSISGHAPVSARLDQWELSSARMASFARGLKVEGVADRAIRFGGQDAGENDAPQRLIISIWPRTDNIKTGHGTGFASP